MLPYSEACERNKQPILAVLVEHLAPGSRVLEIGSGTGQHAVYFARQLPAVRWQPSDRREYLDDLARRVATEGSGNLREAIELDVERPEDWPAAGRFDAIFSANTLHIMSWPAVRAFFSMAGRLLPVMSTARLIVYGPFRYDGRCTASSNEAFDAMLRERDPASGVRDFEAVDALAAQEGFALLDDRAMPANNRTLVWGR